MPIDASRLAGVYLLTPDTDERGFERVLEIARHALDAGVRVVQYRNKTASRERQNEEARRLVALAHSADALAIVNDDLDIALAAGADGLHLGREDGSLEIARTALKNGLLGASCYDDPERARRAVAAGADVLAFGSMFASPTKPAAVRAPLTLLTQARERWPALRVVAIGGIGAANIAEVSAAGAHAAAVISAVFDAADPRRAAEELIRQFEKGRTRNEPQRATV